MQQRALLLSALVAVAQAQQAGTQKSETKPSLTWQKCTASGCTDQSGSVGIDANWRWVHSTSGSTNCYTGNTWDATLCPDDETCATNCALDGADYSSTYGVEASGESLSLTFKTGSNVGSRLFLMEDDSTYQIFKLLNQEFTFDVDVSALPAYENNKAGAKYGTGYCDAQCPRDLKFINGQGNVDGWEPSSNDANAGVGGHGSCCAEMDIWEANSISTAVTAHPCKEAGQTMCEGDNCGGTYSSTRYAGTCDPDGCDINPYRMGNESFYGPGKTVDTSSKMTVVTQFITSDGTATGTLSEIKRIYVQNGKVIANSASDITGVTGNSINSDFCTAQKEAFGDQDVFAQYNGMSGMGEGLEQGMVLVMSLWDDHYANMLWLDSNYPTDATATDPGVARGTCGTDSGKPSDVESASADAKVVFSNIKVGPIGSTYSS
ncbi:hypothetical protein N7533_013428 [Penicillium manginii]|uniref:uncharacterized protein n=1 Tax=Penicillium manginii TaxID=203109 RepID=UPI002547113C|nr:uncharacterized protein N7533_013428 [Penicillium manginii]KAJ5732981.1 hypothetical protein N7533_013428 [Penicillium manginii]